jgi:hypothetical protein
MKNLIYNNFFVLFCVFFIAAYLCADQPANSRLVDKICAVVGEEQVILHSDIRRRAQERSLSNEAAQQELMGERALRIYIKKNPTKINISDIDKDAKDHIENILNNNKLTIQALEKALIEHYKITYTQWEYDIKSAALSSRIEALLANTIEISDNAVKEEYAKKIRSTPKEFEIIFISIMPSAILHNKSQSLKAQLNKANNIKQDILSNSNFDTLKVKYQHDNEVSFLGPIDYKEGVLKSQYERQIKKNPRAKLSEPFIDGQNNNVVTMIWKVKKAQTDNQTTALENVRKDLYRGEVQRGREAIIKNILAEHLVEINCKW